jgi:hypothetical protein
MTRKRKGGLSRSTVSVQTSARFHGLTQQRVLNTTGLIHARELSQARIQRNLAGELLFYILI